MKKNIQLFIVLLMLSFPSAMLAQSDASFSYPSDTLCLTDSSVVPTFMNGGFFFELTQALALDSTTGIIDPWASAPGAYVVTHIVSSPNPDTASIIIYVFAIDDPTFYFIQDTVCQGAGISVPVITGIGGGLFTSTPAGLVISPSTGAVNPASSTLGTYMVTYTTAGRCPASMTVPIVIMQEFDAFFAYPFFATCGTGLGVVYPDTVFSNIPGFTQFIGFPSAIVMDSLGGINMATTPADTYMIYHVTGGLSVCRDTHVVTMVIHQENSQLSIIYPKDTFCWNEGIVTPVITSLEPGAFTPSPGLFMTSMVTGAVDISNSVPGRQYIVSYEVAMDLCQQIVYDTFFVLSVPSGIIYPNGAGDSLISSWGGPGATYQWYLDSIPIGTGQIIPLGSSGNYSVDITESHGCQYTVLGGFIFVDAPEVAMEILSVQLWPQPAVGLLHIRMEMEEAAKIEITVMDLNGRKLRRVSGGIRAKSQEIELDISELAQGVYLLEFRKEDGSRRTLRFMKG